MDDRDRALIAAAAGIDGGDSIFDALDDYFDGLDLAARRDRLDRVWLQAPIPHAEAKSAYPDLRDQFDILQGDVIRTDAAYLLGERQTQGGTSVLASASCDSVVRPKPRQGTILLLPVVPFTAADFKGGTEEKRRREHDGLLETLTAFNTTRSLYLPVLPGDRPDVLF